MPRPQPRFPEPDTQAFWDATKEHKLTFQVCNNGHTVFFPARALPDMRLSPAFREGIQRRGHGLHVQRRPAEPAPSVCTAGALRRCVRRSRRRLPHSHERRRMWPTPRRREDRPAREGGVGRPGERDCTAALRAGLTKSAAARYAKGRPVQRAALLLRGFEQQADPVRRGCPSLAAGGRCNGRQHGVGWDAVLEPTATTSTRTPLVCTTSTSRWKSPSPETRQTTSSRSIISITSRASSISTLALMVVVLRSVSAAW